MKQILFIRSALMAMLALSGLLIGTSCGRNEIEDSAHSTETTDVAVSLLSSQTVKYEETDELFPNPERGFYRYTQSGDALTERQLFKYRADNMSLIYRIYYLKEYRDSRLKYSMLQQFRNDMALVRKSGMKVILRFAYSGDRNEPDAPMKIIKRHLGQLKPLLEEHKDVIAVVQAGFIGAWGEWYYTTNNLRNDNSRKELLDTLLKTVPADRFIQVRTPGYKTAYLGMIKEIAPLSADKAFGPRAVARIGHHNDCFLANETDMGTYKKNAIDKEKALLHEEGLYVPIGGETCLGSGSSPADCAKAEHEMRYLRWSYLNRTYHRTVTGKWERDGCIDDINRNLGYRLVLRKGIFSDKHAPGSDLTVNLTIDNVGYAPMFNPRKAKLILRDMDAKRTYAATLPDDPRKWQPDRSVELKANVALPKDIPAGSYRLYLFLPDPEPTLHDRPDYAVRLANKGCWEAATGYNDLNVTIDVRTDHQLPAGTSAVRFAPIR